jgi:hypothetical protein
MLLLSLLLIYESSFSMKSFELYKWSGKRPRIQGLDGVPIESLIEADCVF